MTQIEFTLECLAEDTEVRGNAMASGDDHFDREVEDKIIADLEGGNEWAWCCVKVTARAGGAKGTDYLGCCSYAGEEEFRKDAYFADMKECAQAELLAALADAHRCAEELGCV